MPHHAAAKSSAVNSNCRMRPGRKAAPYRYWLPGRAAALVGDGDVRLTGRPPVDQRAWLAMAQAVLRRRIRGRQVGRRGVRLSC
jgi:hypothetical protein